MNSTTDTQWVALVTDDGDPGPLAYGPFQNYGEADAWRDKWVRRDRRIELLPLNGSDSEP